MSLPRVNTRTGLLLLVLVLAALLLAGPAHGLLHHDGGTGAQTPDDCQFCSVHLTTFAVVDLVPAALGPASKSSASPAETLREEEPRHKASPRAPPRA